MIKCLDTLFHSQYTNCLLQLLLLLTFQQLKTLNSENIQSFPAVCGPWRSWLWQRWHWFHARTDTRCRPYEQSRAAVQSTPSSTCTEAECPAPAVQQTHRWPETLSHKTYSLLTGLHLSEACSCIVLVTCSHIYSVICCHIHPHPAALHKASCSFFSSHSQLFSGSFHIAILTACWANLYLWDVRILSVTVCNKQKLQTKHQQSDIGNVASVQLWYGF